MEASHWLKGLNLRNSRHWPFVQKSLSFHMFQTAISTIRLQSQQSDCNLSNQTAILLHCSLIVEITVRLWGLHSVCCNCSLIAEIAV